MNDRWPPHKDPPLFARGVQIMEAVAILLIVLTLAGTLLTAIGLVTG